MINYIFQGGYALRADELIFELKREYDLPDWNNRCQKLYNEIKESNLDYPKEYFGFGDAHIMIQTKSRGPYPI